MPRRQVIRNAEFPYHVSARCNNKDWFSIPLPQVWRIFSDYLYFVTFAFEVEIHAFVLMNNHYHLILNTPLANIDSVMNYFQRETSRSIARSSDRINHVYGGTYFSSLIRDLNHYNNVYKYVLRNPIKAGICDNVESYSYSSLRGIMGLDRLRIPIFANEDVFTDLEETLRWLNADIPEDVSEVIRKGLRGKEFAESRCIKTGKLHDLATHRF